MIGKSTKTLAKCWLGIVLFWLLNLVEFKQKSRNGFAFRRGE